jgi:hypothetical protein
MVTIGSSLITVCCHKASKSAPAGSAKVRLRPVRFAGHIGPNALRRGLAQGTVSASGLFAPGTRRVVVRARYTRQKPGELGAAQAHLRYIQRDGVTREGNPGRLYDAAGDDADGRAFLERSEHDPHQFRFIVSAEDSDRLADLKPLIRDLMQQMERDLGTELDWIAVDHFNTGHPHTHIVIRGRDARGEELVMARDYIGAWDTRPGARPGDLGAGSGDGARAYRQIDTRSGPRALYVAGPHSSGPR